MIHFLNILSFFLEWTYVFVFFWILHTFLPVRQNWIAHIPAFFACSFFAVTIIYSNDLANLLGSLIGFSLYLILFHRGRWVEKLTAVLIFYPAVIAINYMMQDIGTLLFFGITKAPNETSAWTPGVMLLSTAIHAVTLLARLLFWTGAWLFLKKYLRDTTYTLTNRMWLIVDILMLASVVSIFTIIYFMPDRIIIVYPICAASIFSSFGCIYHDMKNHLLVLENVMADTEPAASFTENVSTDSVHPSIRHLRQQMESYENYYRTGNPYLDVIIRDKAKTAREKQIDFTAILHFADGSFLDPLDISTIFGNALDNAIEASEQLAVSRRVVSVKARRIHDMLVIAVENNALPDADASGKTTKEDTLFHGFGLSNIRAAVDKYDGQCTVKCKDGVFVLKIMIPVEEH